ncbi:MAG: glycerol-3-phosphate dehydrogenase/oxidase [Armatimonadota bacterium]
MRRNLPEMAAVEHDVLVIGGGVIGCGIARDAALRGMRVALVEQLDFGWGTTARSTRLAHGGLRYLEMLDFGMVREGLREREVLFRQAPHLVQPLQFLTPVYEGDPHGPLGVRAGMLLYDWLYRGHSVPTHRMLSRQEVLALEPGLNPEGLRGGALYYDGQIAFPERLCIECLVDAVNNGAQAANRARVEGFLREGQRVVGVRVRDVEDGRVYEVRARVVINAAGPWADRIVRLADPKAQPLLRTTKGIHLIVPRFTERAVVMLARSDARLFFTVPWEGTSLVGTTDTDYDGDPGILSAAGDEVEYLVRETSRVFPKADLSTVHYTTAGVRPLVLAKGVSASRVSRRHKVHDHASDGLPGLITVLGGKITTYRAVAEDAVTAAVRRLGMSARCVTEQEPLGGGPIEDVSALVDVAVSRYGGPRGFTRDQAKNLVRAYGLRYEEVAELALSDPALRQPVCEGAPEIMAQVAYAASKEMARSLSDALLRRTGVGLRPGHGLAGARQAATVMGRVLGWDVDRIYSEVQEYRDELKLLSTEGVCR